MEHYSQKQKDAISTLLRILIEKCRDDGFAYRQIAVILKVSSSTTVWRWFHGWAFPSQRHVIRIKKFLGIKK